MNKILMSVDMDEWYQCRWATGSGFSMWPDTKAFFKEYYHSDEPIGEIIPLTEKILKIFDENNVQATFFLTGETALYYPDLVKEVASLGHEIGSHNHIHKDYTIQNSKEFFTNLEKSKKILQSIGKQKIIGYRAPNSTLSNYMISDLMKLEFKYDSSVTPTRSFMGKFGNFSFVPLNPYQLALDDFSRKGNSGFWEFPWPVFPILKLPSGSGIMSRVAGYHYTVISVDHALKSGHTVYYFHPYEIGLKPKLPHTDLKVKLFLRNIGVPYFNMLVKIIKRYKNHFHCGRSILSEITGLEYV